MIPIRRRILWNTLLGILMCIVSLGAGFIAAYWIAPLVAMYMEIVP